MGNVLYILNVLFRDIDENLVQEVCSEVAEWYTKAEVGESHTVLKNDGTVVIVLFEIWFTYIFQTI